MITEKAERKACLRFVYPLLTWPRGAEVMNNVNIWRALVRISDDVALSFFVSIICYEVTLL